MLQLKIKNKGVFLFGVLLMVFASQVFSFGGNTAITPLLMAMGAYDYYPLVAALGSAGTMIALPAVGAIGNKLGNRNTLYLGVFLMAFGRCMMQIESNNVFLLMAWQAIGSFGSGLLMAAPYTMVAEVYEPTTAMKHYGLIASVTGLGALVGPLIAGVCTDAGLMRIAFILWIPFAVVSFAIIAAAYPNVKHSGTKFDSKGLLLLAVLISCFVLWTGLSGNLFPWISAGLILPVIVILSGILLVKHSNQCQEPAVPLYILKYPRFRVAFFTNLCAAIVPTCITGYLLVYILYSMNQSATVGSTCSMPYTIVLTIAGMFVGQILAKNFLKNIRTLSIAAAATAVISIGMLCLLQPDSSMVFVWIASAFGGITSAVANSCLTPYFQFGMPASDYASAQGMFTFGATGGAVVFVSIVGALVNASGGNIKVVFYSGFVMMVLMAIIVLSKLRITEEEAAKVMGGQN